MKKQNLFFVGVFSLGFSLCMMSCKNGKKDTSNTDSVVTSTPVTSNKSNSSINNSTPSTNNTTTNTTDQPNKEETTGALYSSPEGMAKFLDAVKQKFNGDVKVMAIHFYEDGRAMFPAQDPNKKENVDQYTYKNGSWEAPVPVELSGSGKLEDNIFSLMNDIDLTKIPGLVKEAQEKTKDLEGAKIDHVYATLTLIPKGKDDKVNIRVPVSGTRKSKTLMANGKGVVKSFN